MSDEMFNSVRRAIDGVRLFSRYDKYAAIFPIEICRYGVDGEPEIVVVNKYPHSAEEVDALMEEVSSARAHAAVRAMQAYLERQRAD